MLMFWGGGRAGNLWVRFFLSPACQGMHRIDHYPQYPVSISERIVWSIHPGLNRHVWQRQSKQRKASKMRIKRCISRCRTLGWTKVVFYIVSRSLVAAEGLSLDPIDVYAPKYLSSSLFIEIKHLGRWLRGFALHKLSFLVQSSSNCFINVTQATRLLRCLS